jgi:hypothetical protein
MAVPLLSLYVVVRVLRVRSVRSFLRNKGFRALDTLVGRAKGKAILKVLNGAQLLRY